MSRQVDARIGRRMEKAILRAAVERGWDNSAYVVISRAVPESQSLSMDRVLSMVDGMINDGLLVPVGSHEHGQHRGLTIKGWERLYELEHPRREWLGRHWFSLVVAGTAVLSSVTAAVTLIVGSVFS